LRVRRNRRRPIAAVANPRIPTVRVEESPGGAIVTTGVGDRVDEVMEVGVGVGQPGHRVGVGVGDRVVGVKRGFRVGVGEGPPTGGGVGVRVGAIARVLVGVRVVEGIRVGVGVGIKAVRVGEGKGV